MHFSPATCNPIYVMFPSKCFIPFRSNWRCGPGNLNRGKNRFRGVAHCPLQVVHSKRVHQYRSPKLCASFRFLKSPSPHSINTLHPASYILEQDFHFRAQDATYEDLLLWFAKPALFAFDHFSPTSMLADHHLRVGAYALCRNRWGELWPMKVRILHWPANEKALARIHHFHLRLKAHPEYHSPEMAIVFLYTPGHNMMSIHTGSFYLALDGQDHPELKLLAEQALAELHKLDPSAFPLLKVDTPSYWVQTDSVSCGWHLLHFLEAALQKSILDQSIPGNAYEAPLPTSLTDLIDWTEFASHVRTCAASMGVKEHIEEVAGNNALRKKYVIASSSS